VALKINDIVYVTLSEMTSILDVSRPMIDYWIKRNQIDGIINMDDVQMIEQYIGTEIPTLKKRKYKNYIVPLSEVLKKKERAK